MAEGDHIVCYKCQTGYYSSVNETCPACGAWPLHKLFAYLFIGALVSLVLGAIVLVFYAKRNHWHKATYLFTIVLAIAAMAFMSDGFTSDMESGLGIILTLLNLISIPISVLFLILPKKWLAKKLPESEN